jgi:hypothetical protein
VKHCSLLSVEACDAEETLGEEGQVSEDARENMEILWKSYEDPIII